MANVVYSNELLDLNTAGSGVLSRLAGSYRLWIHDLVEAIAESRRDYQMGRALGDLDVAQLRDIGVDRDAC